MIMSTYLGYVAICKLFYQWISLHSHLHIVELELILSWMAPQDDPRVSYDVAYFAEWTKLWEQMSLLQDNVGNLEFLMDCFLEFLEFQKTFGYEAQLDLLIESLRDGRPEAEALLSTIAKTVNLDVSPYTP